MTTPKRVSATQKKKRLLQLRDAQRRRRERLKDDSQHFVQIILPEVVLLKLREIVRETGETLQHIIGRLVEESIEKMPSAHSALRTPPRDEDAPKTLETPAKPSDSVAPKTSKKEIKAPVTSATTPDLAAVSKNRDGAKAKNQPDLFG